MSEEDRLYAKLLDHYSTPYSDNAELRALQIKTAEDLEKRLIVARLGFDPFVPERGEA